MLIEITLSDGTTESARYHKPLRKNQTEAITPDKFFQRLCSLYSAGRRGTDEYIHPISYKVVEE